MARRRVANPLALAVLSCLDEKAMHPYEISSTLRTRGKEQSIKLNYGSLYSVVDALQRHGLIEAQETSRTGRRPERTTYAITPAGRAEMQEWLADLLATPAREYTGLEAGLSLMGALPPDDVATLLTKRAQALRMELSAQEEADRICAEAGLPELLVVEGNYRLAVLRAELAFVTELAERIRGGALGGIKIWRRLHELRADGMSFEQIMADAVGLLGPEAAVLAGDPP